MIHPSDYNRGRSFDLTEEQIQMIVSFKERHWAHRDGHPTPGPRIPFAEPNTIRAEKGRGGAALNNPVHTSAMDIMRNRATRQELQAITEPEWLAVRRGIDIWEQRNRQER